jgi:tetratricopeptide (TPR) repeat protein
MANKMSGAATAAAEADQNDDVCANCGIAQVDEIKLKDCDGCDLVKYCGDNCREEHREQHEDECKKRARKLHDDDLFTLPDGTHLGECPICFLPMPLDQRKSLFNTCCSKMICMGCIIAQTSSINDQLNASRCPFCREPAPDGSPEDINEESRSRLLERVKANDPAAMREWGRRHYNEGDYDSAFDYYTKASELGDIDAHCLLGHMYWMGEGVEKDEKKVVYFLEKAAIGGHAYARNVLAAMELNDGRTERAVKHLIIAAKLGCETSMKDLWWYFKDGNINKEDLDATLRAHQAAVDATKSSERTFAEVFQMMENNR